MSGPQMIHALRIGSAVKRLDRNLKTRQAPLESRQNASQWQLCPCVFWCVLAWLLPDGEDLDEARREDLLQDCPSIPCHSLHITNTAQSQRASPPPRARSQC